ncbi:unnamed protein product [Effrenium voratum]|nr:unnamed protein product [Effrenium voratum]
MFDEGPQAYRVRACDQEGECLFTFRIQRLRWQVLPGPSEGKRKARPLVFGAAARGIPWGDGIRLNLEIQISLLLMGLSLPAVALPKLFLQLDVKAGRIEATCQQAGEEGASVEVRPEEDWTSQVMSSISSAAWSAAESAANMAYDFPLLKRLFKERFRFALSFDRGEGEAARLRTALELAIPKSSAAEVVTQCLKQFLTEQLKKMDVLQLFRDLLAAISKDLTDLALPADARPKKQPAGTKHFL